MQVLVIAPILFPTERYGEGGGEEVIGDLEEWRDAERCAAAPTAQDAERRAAAAAAQEDDKHK